MNTGIPENTTSPSRTRQPRILWSVVEEHLEEAAFLWLHRERALLDPHYVLGEVEQGDEARLLAHLGGLEVGGEPVARRLLLPALEEEEPGRVASAAYALLASSTSDWSQAVLTRLVEGEAQRPGLLRALKLSGRAGLDAELLGLLPRLELPLRASLLEVLAFRRVDTVSFLEKLPVQEEDASLFVSVLRASRGGGRPIAEEWVRRGLAESRSPVRDAAIETGLLRGSRAAWQACRRVVEERAPMPRLALLTLALSGGPADLRLLVDLVASPQLRAEALWALGFSGRVAAAEAALSALGTEDGPLALDTFCLITGLPPDEYLDLEEPGGGGEEEPPEDEHPEGAGEVASLPGPQPRPGRVRTAAVEQWWSRARGRFAPDARYRQGLPWTPDALLLALQEAPMNQRPVLAWELALRTRGACHVETGTWGCLQRQQLKKAREFRLETLSRAFEGVMTV